MAPSPHAVKFVTEAHGGSPSRGARLDWRNRSAQCGSGDATPEELYRLLVDLLEYCNQPTEATDAITVMAVAHAQFELIHPFADGNGRLGRILSLWVLTRFLRLAQPPPLSAIIERRRSAYLAGIQQFRLGTVSAYAQWCADACIDSADYLTVVRTRLEDLRTSYDTRTANLRRDSAGRRLTQKLLQHPVLTSELAARLLNVSERAALQALVTLQTLDIVHRTRALPDDKTGRPRDRFVAHEVFASLRF